MIIIDEIDNTINTISIDVKKLDGKSLISQIITSYSTNKSYCYPLWEHLENKISLLDPQGWKTIGNFQSSEEKIMFIEPDRLSSSSVIFQFNNSKDLINLIGNCFNFVFYITDKTGSFLICFNDHDYLIGCGTARDWIMSLKID
jgi:hypothetical protein